MGRWIRQAVSWAAALFTAVCLCNAAMFLYEVQPGWIERDKGATLAIWDPGTELATAMEGRGRYHVDSKGYVNDHIPEEPGYCLAVGASFTQGKEVENGERYTDLLNGMLSEAKDGKEQGTDHALPSFVYNVSQEGYFFPDIARGFYALTREFPDAGAIVIETGKTAFSDRELEDALNQRDYDENQNGENILAALSSGKRLSMKVKEVLPLLNILVRQAETVKNRWSNDAKTVENKGADDAKMVKNQGAVDAETVKNREAGGKKTEKESDPGTYSDKLEPVLQMLREEFSGTLVIAYHPDVTILEDGSLSPVRYEETEVFARLCRENGIIFMDVTQAMLNAYEDDYSVPYGFMNTSMGKGHFSQAGHRVMAEELYKILVRGDGR